VATAELEKRKRIAQKNNIPNPSTWRTIARPNQIAPAGDWLVWLLLAGRGFGKTRTITEWANEQAYYQPGSRGAIVAATAADARDVVVEGDSGIKSVNRLIQYEPSKRRLTWPNGSIATLFSADEPERLRGPQFHWAVCDELAAWRYPEAWDLLMLGLRLGIKPRCAVATTPKPTRLLKQIVADALTVMTRGSTYDNKPNLAPSFFQQIVSKYEGTRLGRQEINAEILDDMPGALWQRDRLDALRVTSVPPLTRICVALDPAATSNSNSDEAGVIVAGVDDNGTGYVLDDCSLRGTPHEWATAAVAAYHRHFASVMVAESNQGGEMVSLTISTIPNAPDVKLIHASLGKVARAEPVAAKYEQGLVHHVGFFPQLEDEMCSYVAGAKSPNRLDALVYAMSELMQSGEAVGEANYASESTWRFSNSEY
jgi:phage terminase large subunit-like protein